MKIVLVLVLLMLALFLTLGAAIPLVFETGERSRDTQREFDLSLKDRPGDVSYYALKTIYYHGNSLGITHSREELIASFRREVVKVDAGAHLVRFTWNDARIGAAPDMNGEIGIWKTLPYARNFTYVIDFNAPNFPGGVDFRPLPETLEGFKFMVNVLDAHAQFELLRTEASGGISRLTRTGDRISNPGANQGGAWDFRHFITDSDFANGGYETLFTGISHEHGRELAVLEFINTESRITNTVQLTSSLSFEQQGTSNFWGHIYIDCETGKLVRGDLYEYVIVETKMPGQERPTRLFERRLIEIRALSKEEFENEE